MLGPKRTKFKKVFKLKRFGLSHNQISFGEFAIQATEGGRVFPNQLEAARRVLNKQLKKEGQLWVRAFPHFSITKKPNEVRMGKGKGAFHSWYCNILEDQILFEFSTSLPIRSILETANNAISKLPVKCNTIRKENVK